MYLKDTKEQIVRVKKCDFERSKERGFFDGRLYAPLYEKGLKETQNKPMETTICTFYTTLTFNSIFLSSFP